MRTTNTARAAYIPAQRRLRTRIGTAMPAKRRNAFLDGFVARCNTGLITVAQYLADTLHADPDFVRRFASPYGKTARKVFEAEYGTEPPKAGIARVGHRLFPVYAYTAEQTAVLDKAAREYRHTAALLAA